MWVRTVSGDNVTGRAFTHADQPYDVLAFRHDSNLCVDAGVSCVDDGLAEWLLSSCVYRRYALWYLVDRVV